MDGARLRSRCSTAVRAARRRPRRLCGGPASTRRTRQVRIIAARVSAQTRCARTERAGPRASALAIPLAAPTHHNAARHSLNSAEADPSVSDQRSSVSRRLRRRLDQGYRAFFVKKGRNPVAWIGLPLALLLIAAAMASAVLARDLDGVQGGVWGYSGLDARIKLAALQVPTLIWILLASAVPAISRSMAITLACWFGLPLALWLGHTGMNLLQAINVRMDDSPARTLCLPVEHSRRLGCASVSSKRGNSRYCADLTTVQDWPAPGATAQLQLVTDAPQVCFSAHAGFLSAPWIDQLRPHAAAAQSARTD